MMTDQPYSSEVETSKTLKLSLIAGARPNFMKIAPIIRELKRHENLFEWNLIHTGQHYDRDMSDVFFEELGIPKPEHFLDAGGGSHAEQTAKIMLRYEKVCLDDRPDMVVVVGDVNSTLACSIVAKKLGIKVAHVEAGLRSGDMTMPEEINRIVTDSISDLFFVTEPSGIDNLTREGHQRDAIHFVGHVMIDNLIYQVEKLRSVKVSAFPTNALKSQLGAYGIVTLHRPSNVDDELILAPICEALSEISAELPLIFPIHPRTAASVKKFGLAFPDTIIPTAPLPYMEFLNLWKDSKLIMTDSGGLQEESTALGVPCLTLRENTERPITISQGTNVLVGRDTARIKAEARRVLQSPAITLKKRPEFWDGDAAKRIIEILTNFVN